LEAENEALEAVKKAGVEIIYPDKTLFADKIKDSFDKYKEDKEFYQMIKDIQATK
jgi:TRAP-type C4-dicarboxylate transport system substrate-binding protein